jgi:hypothetical protein
MSTPDWADASGSRPTGHPSVVERIVSNPFVGFAPWIALAILEGPGRLPLAVAVGLSIAVAFLAVDKLLGHSTKILAVVDVVSFAIFLVVVLAASPTTLQWLELWFGELANILLVLVVAGSMVARVPFTIQYAREQTDPKYWDTPVFLRINYVVTGVWGLAFLVSAIVGFYGDAVLHDSNNVWTGWIIQVAATLVAVQFTVWYPDYATARALASAGVSHDPAPPVATFLLPLQGYLIAIGILELSLDAGPAWLGIAMIVFGVVVGNLLRRSLPRPSTE